MLDTANDAAIVLLLLAGVWIAAMAGVFILMEALRRRRHR
jgi:hypothetical protein